MIWTERGARATRVFTVCGLALCVCLGCNSGGVDALGSVTVEGTPAAQGRLTFLPVGGGKRAFGLVNDQGQFALSTTEGPGAPPGDYSVSFVQRPAGEVAEQLKSQLRGVAVNAGDLKVTYKSPDGEGVVIPESGLEGLVIDIRADKGWTRMIGD